MSNRRFLRSVLTTEPDLDPPEPVDYRTVARRRDQRQKWDAALWNRSYKESEAEYHHRMEEQHEQEEINTWRMYDAADQLENSLLEQEDR